MSMCICCAYMLSAEVYNKLNREKVEEKFEDTHILFSFRIVIVEVSPH